MYFMNPAQYRAARSFSKKRRQSRQNFGHLLHALFIYVFRGRDDFNRLLEHCKQSLNFRAIAISAAGTQLYIKEVFKFIY